MNSYINKANGRGLLRVQLPDMIRQRDNADNATDSPAFHNISEEALPQNEEVKETTLSKQQLIMVIDISGSMCGELITGVKKAACEMIDKCADRDITVITFNDNVYHCDKEGFVCVQKTVPPNTFNKLARQPALQVIEAPQNPCTWYLPAACSQEERERLKTHVKGIQACGHTAFLDAMDYALKLSVNGCTVVAMTDGQTNSGLGFDQCPRLGNEMLTKKISFNLIIPYTVHNYCNLEGLKPLYTLCNGNILYANTQKIGEAFEKSRFPLAFDCTIAVNGAESKTISQSYPKITLDSVLYIPFAVDDHPNIAIDQSCLVDLSYTDPQGSKHSFNFEQKSELQQEDGIAFEYIQQSVSRLLQEGNLEDPAGLIADMCTVYGVDATRKAQLLQTFGQIYTLLANPLLAKVPSQSDHTRGLLQTLSQNPSSNPQPPPLFETSNLGIYDLAPADYIQSPPLPVLCKTPSILPTEQPQVNEGDQALQ